MNRNPVGRKDQQKLLDWRTGDIEAVAMRVLVTPSGIGSEFEFVIVVVIVIATNGLSLESEGIDRSARRPGSR